MNKNAIQRFAIWARTELISQVSQRAYQYDITEDGYGDYNDVAVGGRLLTEDEKKQRQELIDQIRRKGYAQVMEEVAYTWFNRFIALRYMEVNNYLPTHIRVFSDASGAFKPEILTSALHLDLPGLDTDKVSDLIEKNQSEDLYRYLLLTQCNALSVSLPRMFEDMGSYTELLLPNNILRQDGVLGRMVADIPEEDWTDQVQIIGWLYQYYNTELKDDTFSRLKKNVKITKERIPSATQLFTPDWIVRYMVENSLGRLWIEHEQAGQLSNYTWGELSGKTYGELAGRRNGPVTEEDLAKEYGWKYFLPEAEQNEAVKKELDNLWRAEYVNLRPQDIKIIDPCMGSGHILVYAFDVLVQFYKKVGFNERDAAQSILENNLYGLDIDDRAAQLAYFAVMMKARQYDRRIFTRNIQPHVYAIVDSGWTGGAYQLDMGNFLLSGEHQETLNYLLEVFRNAKELGSIIKLEDRDYQGLKRAWTYTASQTAENVNMLLWYSAVEEIVPQLIDQAILLSQKYDVVVTNPPYMAVSNTSATIQDYAKSNFPDSKTDLFAIFIERCRMMAKANGYQAMITQHAWMFLSSFEKLREKIQSTDIVNMAHLGARAFEEIGGEVVQTTSFVLRNTYLKGVAGRYCRLVEPTTQKGKEDLFLAGKNRYVSKQYDFSKIPGSPVAYWVSPQLLSCFEGKEELDKSYAFREGIHTADNNRFLRLWYEVDFSTVVFDAEDYEDLDRKGTWVPYNKGGEFRKWYGNNDYIIAFNEKYRNEMANLQGHVRPSQSLYFKAGATWTAVSGGKFGLRYYPKGFLFDAGGQVAVGDNILNCMAYLNSSVFSEIAKITMPTINFKCGIIKTLPNLCIGGSQIDKLVSDCIAYSKADWDSFETSWDFEMHPIVKKALSRSHWNDDSAITIEYVYKYVAQDFEERFKRLRANEETLNRIFIDTYRLQDELTPEVEDKDVTVRRADLGRDIRSMISYAVGCMFGRYSLTDWGLAYAGGEWNLGGRSCADYGEFRPDKDNIIPICDDEYFDDDIVGRFINFVEIVFGKETLEENLKFIADALGGKGTPREVIRNYFLNDFYADHLRTYQKRPIYWLFDSGKKNGFKALIYMHRYQSDLLARMRTDYVHEQQERYRTQLKHIGDAMDSASASERIKLSKQQKKLQEQALELQKYEEKVHHLADQNIKIDLDDGVKHNYALFEDVLAKIK